MSYQVLNGNTIVFSDGVTKRIDEAATRANKNARILCIFEDGARLLRLDDNYYRMSHIYPDYKTMNRLPDFYDTSALTTMSAMFFGCRGLEDISALASIDVSHVKNLDWAFGLCKSLRNISPLASWQTKSVERLYQTFHRCWLLSGVSALSDWDVSNLKVLNDAFFGCLSLRTVAGIANWNVSKMMFMDETFADCEELLDLSPLEKWDVAHVVSMERILENCPAENPWGLTQIPEGTRFGNGSLVAPDDWCWQRLAKYTDYPDYPPERT